MRVEKKQIAKEDGRYLVYYHFPGAATPEQTAAFAAVDAPAPEAAASKAAMPSDVPPPAPQEEKARV